MTNDQIIGHSWAKPLESNYHRKMELTEFTRIFDYLQTLFYYLIPWMFVYLLNKDDFYKVAAFLIKQTSKFLTIFVLSYNARHFINHTLLSLPIYSTKHFIKYLLLKNK